MSEQEERLWVTLSNSEIAERLGDLLKAITAGDSGYSLLRVCTMHIPAEPNSDMDFVVSEAIRRLNAADSREKLASWMISKGFSTGHGSTIDDLLAELGWQIDEMRDDSSRDCLSEVRLLKGVDDYRAGYKAGMGSSRERIAALQAKIDALMLEYCPDEVTPEQSEEWGKNQKPVDDDGNWGRVS